MVCYTPSPREQHWGHPTRKNLGQPATPCERQPVIKGLADP